MNIFLFNSLNRLEFYLIIASSISNWDVTLITNPLIVHSTNDVDLKDFFLKAAFGFFIFIFSFVLEEGFC